VRVRIGCDDFGDPISIDTTGVARIGLCGPPGSGKTTTCRYLARRWTAVAGAATCAVVTARSHEYQDLADSQLITLATTLDAAGCGGLLIVDDADDARPGVIVDALQAPYPVIVIAAFGPALIIDRPHQHPDGAPWLTASYALHHQPGAAGDIAGQGCLDWPDATTSVLLDRRPARDFPLHRWAVRRAIQPETAAS
jgi:Viral (Superfamily 1) RNA helicase